MKKKNLFWNALTAVLFCGCTGVQMKEAPVTMSWEKGEKDPATGYYSNTFLIRNLSDKPLDKNWVIYFSQLPQDYRQPDNNPIKIEAVNPNYFKMYPTAGYHSIQAHDSLQVSFWNTSGLLKRIQAPEGAYMIVSSGKKASAPLPVGLKVQPFTTSIEADNVGVQAGKISDGKIMYDQNERFNKPESLSSTDMLPTLKNVMSVEGRSTISRDVKLNFDEAYAGEARILTEKLKGQYGIDAGAGKSGSTTITLTKLPGNVVPVNDEYYELSIQENAVTIKGNTSHAVFDGVQTLLALFREKSFPCTVENLSIKDYPGLPYRGIMLDVSRNFTTKDNLLKLLDELSAYKLNALHLHFSDDEGWRLEIPGLEELTSVGARRGHTYDESECLYPGYDGTFDPENRNSMSNGYYSKSDFIELLRFAASRHIQVIPEIESPGHARASIVSMKARYKKYAKKDPAKAQEYLLSDLDDKSSYASAQLYNDNVMNVALPSTYRFLDKVVKEIAAMYKEAGVPLNSIHIGGDEVADGAWLGSKPCQDLMKKLNVTQSAQLEDYYFKQIALLLEKNNLKMSGWQEIALNHTTGDDAFFSKRIAGAYCWRNNPEWNSAEIPYNLANKGYDVILCNVNSLYIDMAYNSHPNEPGLYWGGFVDENKSFSVLPFSIYRSLRNKMSGQPVDVILAEKDQEKLTPEGRTHIKGVQAELFSETLRNFGMVQYYIFPKILGMVERGWNAEPQWASINESQQEAEAYEKDLQHFHAVVIQKELPQLSKEGINFRLPQPGIYVKDGWLYANSQIAGAEIRYTTDGSEPTLQSSLWQGQVECTAKMVKAKLFYLGKASVTTVWIEK